MMRVFWGLLMAIAGASMFVCGRTKSEFILYRLLVARSKILWGANVHRFHQASGLVIAVLGVLWAVGIIW